MLKHEVEEKMTKLEQEVLGKIKVDHYLDKVNEDLCTALTVVARCQVLKGVMIDLHLEDLDLYVCESYTLEEVMEFYQDTLDVLKRIDEVWGACDVETDNPMDGDFAAYEYQV